MSGSALPYPSPLIGPTETWPIMRHRLSAFTTCGSTAFEHVVMNLRLMPGEYVNSAELKEWVWRNKDHKYVPPELLAAWSFTVNVYAAA